MNNLFKFKIVVDKCLIVKNVLQRRCCASTAEQANKQFPHKIFSGIQPTNSIHVGNYLGAIKTLVKCQDNNEDVTLCVVDMHSITVPQNRENLRHNILNVTATLLACGIDVTKTTLFLQSDIKEHTELNWILSCLTTLPRLGQLPQYKEKSRKLREVPLGLYIYPVLQSADILLHKATHVPVGEDQVQHIQLCQHLAKLFNNNFGDTFPHCHAIINVDSTARIRSLREPTKKMSKSDLDKSCIFLTDKPEKIVEKVKKAVTDFTSDVTYDPNNRPGVSNLLTIHSNITGKKITKICEDVKNLDTGLYKLRMADEIIECLKPIRINIENYLNHPDFLAAILVKGKQNASAIAERTMLEVRQKVGLGYDVPDEPRKILTSDIKNIQNINVIKIPDKSKEIDEIANISISSCKEKATNSVFNRTSLSSDLPSEDIAKVDDENNDILNNKLVGN